jgi:hypothetical protein
MGALLKDPKTGDIMSVHYQNIRKLGLDELILLLPSNFDSEILKTLKLYRYNRPGAPDTVPTQEKETTTEDNTRTLRSGKTIQINHTTLPSKYAEIAIHAQWLNTVIVTPNKAAAKPCLKSRIQLPLSPYEKLSQYYTKELWLFPSTFENKPVNIKDVYVNSKYRSNFQSHKPGILSIKLNNQLSYAKKSTVLDNYRLLLRTRAIKAPSSLYSTTRTYSRRQSINSARFLIYEYYSNCNV